ncbi:MAG: mannose-1-phosphate guanylyltransferase [Crocinitomicaceae bacterium]
MSTNNYGLIMAGGVGSRFWPMSTPQKPKQFLDVLGIGKSLLRLTFERMQKSVPTEHIYILTNTSYRELVKEQLPELSFEQILCEPMRKNTAPCIAYAAAKIYANNPNATLIISPSDHLIVNEQRFQEIISTAIGVANDQKHLVTLGIEPNRPDTGYGYIEFDLQSGVQKGQATEVIQFREKPNLETAKEFLAAHNFYWNAGIFVWRADVILDALHRFQPMLHEIFTSDVSAYGTTKEADFLYQAFDQCEDISIDFAVMEHAKNVSVVLADFDWSDLGTWGSLTEHLPKDSSENSIVGDHVFAFDSSNCLVNVPKDKLVLLDGLHDYIVVESDHMLMILKSSNEQQLKNYLKVLETERPTFFQK